MLIVRSIRAPDAGFEGIHARNGARCWPGGARTRMSRTILVSWGPKFPQDRKERRNRESAIRAKTRKNAKSMLDRPEH